VATILRMPLDRPIFVVAPPRCGTTLLYRCISSHPEVGYLMRAHRKLIHSPWLAQTLTRFKLFRDSPRESRDIWYRFRRQIASGMLSKDNKPAAYHDLLTAEDAHPVERSWFPRFLERVVKHQRARRFAAKLPSHSLQLGWLDALFPGSIFVQAMRDWRAVVSSTVIKRFEDFDGRWFGVCPPGWQKHIHDAPALGAAWQYLVVHEYLDREAPNYAGRFFRVQYEELCRNPLAVLQKLFENIDLSWTAEVEDQIPTDIRPPNDRWREQLSPSDLETIERQHGEALRRYEVKIPIARFTKV